MTALHKSVDLLVKANERLYGSWFRKSEDAKHPWAAAVVLNRQGEFVVKLQTHFHRIAANEAEYESVKVLQDMGGWPARQADALKERIVGIEREYDVKIEPT
jgi:hypothetical protein